MLFRDAIEGWKHDGHDNSIVLFNQTQNVLIIPEVKSSLGDLFVQTNSLVFFDGSC